MLSDIIERLNYRYRLWRAERFSDKVGAGVPPPIPASPKNEPVLQIVLRHVFALLGGIIVLTGLGRIVGSFVPSARFGIGVTVIVLVCFWCVIGLTSLASEWITKRSASRDENKRI
jgi:hypothetical protein